MSLSMPDLSLWWMQNWLKTLHWQIIIFGHACWFMYSLYSYHQAGDEVQKILPFFQPTFPADICCIHYWLTGLLQGPCLSRNQHLMQISKSWGHLWNLLLIYPSLGFIDRTVVFRYNLWSGSVSFPWVLQLSAHCVNDEHGLECFCRVCRKS